MPTTCATISCTSHSAQSVAPGPVRLEPAPRPRRRTGGTRWASQRMARSFAGDARRPACCVDMVCHVRLPSFLRGAGGSPTPSAHIWIARSSSLPAAVAARVVRQLLVDQAAEDGEQDLDLAAVGDADRRESLDVHVRPRGRTAHTPRRTARTRGSSAGSSAGSAPGPRPRSRRRLQRLLATPAPAAQPATSVAPGIELVVGAPRLAEHRVVDRVLRREVRVQRRRLHPDAVGDVAQGQGGQALLPRHGPGGFQDLQPRRLTAFGLPIASRFHLT